MESTKNNTEDLLRKGQYENNAKTGVWEFYNKGGEVIQKYDYINKVFVQKKPFDLSTKHWYEDGNTFKEIDPGFGE